MKRLLSFLPIVALAFLAACGPKDADIQTKVNESLKTAPGATASVKEGVATLSGEVADDATKTSAEAAAKEVKGVKSVVNSLTVKPAMVVAPPAAPAMDVLAKGVMDAVKDFPGVTATAADGVITVGGTISADKWKRLKMALDALNPKKVDAKGLTVK